MSIHNSFLDLPPDEQERVVSALCCAADLDPRTQQRVDTFLDWADRERVLYARPVVAERPKLDMNRFTSKARLSYEKKPEPEVEIDEKLWAECRAIVPDAMPHGLPQVLGMVDGCRVIMVYGPHVMLMKPEKEDGDHPPADLSDGANSEEAKWVVRLFGKMSIVLDNRLGRLDFTPYVEAERFEFAAVCLHEAVERRYMAMGKSYGDAHDEANKMELAVRHREQEIEVELPDALL